MGGMDLDVDVDCSLKSVECTAGGFEAVVVREECGPVRERTGGWERTRGYSVGDEERGREGRRRGGESYRRQPCVKVDSGQWSTGHSGRSTQAHFLFRVPPSA